MHFNNEIGILKMTLPFHWFQRKGKFIKVIPINKKHFNQQ